MCTDVSEGGKTALYKLLWKGTYDTPLDEKVQDMSQILAMATRPHSDLVPITSDLTVYKLHCSDTGPSHASQAYVSGKLLPQDLCTCCSSAGNALPQIYYADSLTSFKSLFRYLLRSDQLFKKISTHSQLPPITLILLYFLPDIHHLLACSVVYS